ncbi:MAG: hypothetical protein IPF66_07565 [Holophagales bacterium]|nr:hypothetical protein [Holophagales bacterium]
MREMMTSGAAWDAAGSAHYGLMSVAPGPELSAGPFPRLLFGRLFRLILAALLAGSAILLGG